MSEVARNRARYAPDAQVKRALRLARQEGLHIGGFTLQPDGGVTVFEASMNQSGPREEAPDEALARWQAEQGDR